METPKPFTKENKEYSMQMDPVKAYLEQSTNMVMRKYKLPKEEAGTLVKEAILDKGPHDPVVKHYERDDKLDRHKKKSKLSRYISKVKKDNDILVPSFTVYTDPKKRKSLHSNFVLHNLKERKVAKSEAFKAKTEGDTERYNSFNTLQKTKKIFNNSLSGAYSSKSTILVNPSAHYSLTSITRSVASIGNSVTESMVMGNRHYMNPETVMNHLTAIVTKVDTVHMEDMCRRWLLVIPTVDDVMDMVTWSSDYYWRSEHELEAIREYVETFSPGDRAAVVYNNDLWHLKKLNPKFMKSFLGNLHKLIKYDGDDADKVIKEAYDYEENLARHIAAPHIKGKKIDYKEQKDSDEVKYIAGTCLNIRKVFDKFFEPIRTFFVTEVLPVSIAYVREMLRRVIVLSDTDSTCATYQFWIEWFYGDFVFTSEATALAATIMTINTQAIEHNLKQLEANMNVPLSNRGMLAMKPEFYWYSFTPMTVSKHYYADTAIQEGIVFQETEREVKGVNLVAGNIPREYKVIHNEMMDEIQTCVREHKKIDLESMIIRVADIEREILERIAKGDIGILKMDKIKVASAYKLDETRSPYIHYLLWKEVFEPKYGKVDPPQYTAVKFNTTLDSENRMKAYLNGLEDQALAERFRVFLKKYGKKAFGTFRLNYMHVSEKGVPKEILNAVNIKKIVSDACRPHYMVLESIGFFKKPNMSLVDMGY